MKMNNTKNGYKKKERVLGLKYNTWRDIIIIVTAITLFAYFAIDAKAGVTPRLISPIPYSLVESSNEEVTISPTVKEYIKTIFGKDWKTAYAIARAESGLRHDAKHLSEVEDSIGIFQINIQSATSKVHWSRIPGETLEEKEEWLSNPYNNTLMAYWISSKSGWNPWSVYTSQSYEQYL